MEKEDLPLLRRFLVEPDAPGSVSGLGSGRVGPAELERRWAEDGLLGGDESFLAVALEDGTCVGWVSWKARTHGNWEIGIALRGAPGPRPRDRPHSGCWSATYSTTPLPTASTNA
jgi:hypothetical protein